MITEGVCDVKNKRTSQTCGPCNEFTSRPNLETLVKVAGRSVFSPKLRPHYDPRDTSNVCVLQGSVDPRNKMGPASFRLVAHCQNKLRHSELYFLSLVSLPFCINQLVFGRIRNSTKAHVFGELIASSTELSFRNWREKQIFGGPCWGVVAEFVNPGKCSAVHCVSKCLNALTCC